jgi:hypothetical protein
MMPEPNDKPDINLYRKKAHKKWRRLSHTKNFGFSTINTARNYSDRMPLEKNNSVWF